MVIGEHEREIRNGVTIRRLSLNNYEISYKGESIEIDLNLKPDENYGATYDLGFHRISQEYFSIIHCGEGNGWDANRSCMGSIITFQNRIFLIDAGPHIDKIITSLGICNSQIDGIFQTHVHDDHFAGLTSLFQTGHKNKILCYQAGQTYGTKEIFSINRYGRRIFWRFFEIHDLEIDKWNDIYGLDVMPLYSPHPLETTIFYFRAHGEFGDAVYGHLADIISKKNFKRTIETEKKEGISQDFFDKIWNGYSIKCDIKKIDGGLGFVHGNSKDFINDPSKKLLISHTDWDLSVKEREIGNNAAFGQQDILIPARVDYCELLQGNYLNTTSPEHLIRTESC
jgi:hemerythrin